MNYELQEELLQAVGIRRHISIGLPTPQSATDCRFPLTPECAAMLTERGLTVKMQRGAANAIHYGDEAWRRAGVQLVERNEALACDIVMHLPAIGVRDALRLKRGALLLTFLHAESQSAEALAVLLQRHVIAIALDDIADEHGHKPFADVVRQIDGSAVMTIAASLLADSVHGKGILLGNVPGIVPCEVLIIGSDIAARAAAHAAIGLGATVRMFDNDYYSLREALRELGPGVIGSAIHPHVFISALRSADIVIATSAMQHEAIVGADDIHEMKRGVIAFDLSDRPGQFFPSLRTVDLALASACDCHADSPARTCYINTGNAVPRTVAMALSNTFVNLLDEILVCDGLTNALKLNAGLRGAAYTFLGKPVGAVTAELLGLRQIDINLFLQFS
jgi:alanine dehydrogenase